LFLPDTKDLSLWLTASKVSSDFIVDRLEDCGNGDTRITEACEPCFGFGQRAGEPRESQQFLYRLVRFAQAEQLRLRLAYYPPYHSNTTPIDVVGEVLGGLLFRLAETHQAIQELAAIPVVLRPVVQIQKQGSHASVILVSPCQPVFQPIHDEIARHLRSRSAQAQILRIWQKQPEGRQLALRLEIVVQRLDCCPIAAAASEWAQNYRRFGVQ